MGGFAYSHDLKAYDLCSSIEEKDLNEHDKWSPNFNVYRMTSNSD